MQAEASIDNEATIVGRALHEANRILLAFVADADDDGVVRRWLDDEGKYGYVKQGAARAVTDRSRRPSTQHRQTRAAGPRDVRRP